MYEHDVHSTMPTRYLSKTQKRKVRRNLFEISESYKTDESDVHMTMPRQIDYKPAPRKPGKWRMIEIFTWTAMVTIVAGTMPDWQAFEPLTLPRWDLLDWKAQDDALRLLEEHDIDFSIIAWPCTPWSIMQNLNQKPHQIRALVQQQAEHRRLLVFVERVSHRMYIRKRANVGENPASSHAWEEAPIQAAFSKPGNSEVVTHMCMYNKRRPDNGTLVRKSTRLRGTREVIEACSRRCDHSHDHSTIEGSMKLADGRRMNVSEWAGGYTKAFAKCL